MFHRVDISSEALAGLPNNLIVLGRCLAWVDKKPGLPGFEPTVMLDFVKDGMNVRELGAILKANATWRAELTGLQTMPPAAH